MTDNAASSTTAASDGRGLSKLPSSSRRTESITVDLPVMSAEDEGDRAGGIDQSVQFSSATLHNLPFGADSVYGDRDGEGEGNGRSRNGSDSGSSEGMERPKKSKSHKKGKVSIASPNGRVHVYRSTNSLSSSPAPSSKVGGGRVGVVPPNSRPAERPQTYKSTVWRDGHVRTVASKGIDLDDWGDRMKDSNWHNPRKGPAAVKGTKNITKAREGVAGGGGCCGDRTWRSVVLGLLFAAFAAAGVALILWIAMGNRGMGRQADQASNRPLYNEDVEGKGASFTILPPPPEDLEEICSEEVIVDNGYQACLSVCRRAMCCYMADNKHISLSCQDDRDCQRYREACNALDGLHLEGEAA
uniref:Uncharacterized protein n=1 Tax=Trieres chinensis TaxID=1514140 RepID=A0A7S1Z174_TRICV|mmetsp:Transcript_15208/g.31080  ORF Transcript_15208/g.31080 Transcript_15208/m.31080 type:complete len:357 (+) Transcript_15208:170-1240(+)